MKTIEFIKAVSGTVFGMINTVFNHDKLLIFIGATFLEKLISHHEAVHEFMLEIYVRNKT